MAEFSIQDAAFTGFGVVREHPRALAAWALFALAQSLLFGAIFAGPLAGDMMRLTAAGGQVPRDPAVVFGALGRLTPVLALALASYSIPGAAMIRVILRPADDRFGYLRIGGDELRQFGLGLLMFAVFFGLAVGVSVVLGVAVGIAGAALKLAPFLIGWVALLAIALAMVFVGVRLSLAPALTFDRERISLFGSWALTRGRFWPLFSVYLLTFALVFVVNLLSLLVIFALTALLSGGDIMAAMSVQPPSLQAFFSPLNLVRIVLRAGVLALTWPVALSPASVIYRRFAGSGSAAAEAFS